MTTETADIQHENGDLYDTDTGAFICTIPLEEKEGAVDIPVNIDIYINGYWYTYTVAKREIAE